MTRVAINGFGRIGRTATRVLVENHAHELELVAINTSGSMEVKGWGHLLKYDTAYGKFDHEVKAIHLKDVQEATDQDPVIGQLAIEGLPSPVPVLAQREPGKLPWKDYRVDIVLECTGVFRTEEKVKSHLEAGAKRVLVSAPEKGGNIGTYVLGVNEYQKGKISSSASCTTNCVAPVVAIIQAKFGIKKALMDTIHAYTPDQSLQDGSHKDLRRARAAAQNIIPTTTGAAIATTKTIPELEGLFDGLAFRVPVLVGSITHFVLVTNQKTTVEEVNRSFEAAEKNPRWKGIVKTTREPLVSSDIIGTSESAIVDLNFTQVIDGDLVRVVAWYDNESAYCHRLIEQALEIGTKI